MKRINCQCVYDIPSEYPWIARNNTGVLNGFLNAPIRDYRTGEWQDSVTGDYGYFIPFDEWEKSVREVSTLTDTAERMRTLYKEKQTPTKGYSDGRTARFRDPNYKPTPKTSGRGRKV